MAMVRMDIDQAAQTIQTFGNSRQELLDELQRLRAAIEQLIQTWQGAASQNFVSAYETWTTDFTSKVNELEPLQQGLAQEREQIIEADSSSSFGD